MTLRSPASLIYLFATAVALPATLVLTVVLLDDGRFEPAWFLGESTGTTFLLLAAVHYLRRDYVRQRASERDSAQARFHRRRDRIVAIRERRRVTDQPTLVLPSHAVCPPPGDPTPSSPSIMYDRIRRQVFFDLTERTGDAFSTGD